MFIFKAALTKLLLAPTFHEEIRKQILTAIDCLYLAVFDDDTFGSITTMLTNLHTMYGPITHAELEVN